MFVGGWLLLLVIVVLIALMAREWCGLILRTFDRTDVAVHALAPASAILALEMAKAHPAASEAKALLVVIGMLALATIVALVLGRSRKHRVSIVLAATYLGIPMTSLVWLRGEADGLSIVLWLALVVSGTDIFAYLTGSRIGGPKLAPAISPGKTWSGLTGGVTAAALIGAGGAALVGMAAVGAALLAALLAVLAQAGDLLESWIKRRAGVKDSGALIPGHGGVLDRFDGYMLATPVLALVLLIKGGA